MKVEEEVEMTEDGVETAETMADKIGEELDTQFIKEEQEEEKISLNLTKV